MIKIKPFCIIFWVLWGIFQKNPIYHILWFCTFLNVWKYLIHLVWNYVPIFILFKAWFTFLSLLKWLVLLLNHLFAFSRFYYFCWSFQIFIIYSQFWRNLSILSGIITNSSFMIRFFFWLRVNVRIYRLQKYWILILMI